MQNTKQAPLARRGYGLLASLLAMFAVISVLAVAASPAFAQTEPVTASVSPSTQNASVGASITVDIELDSSVDLIASGVDITFDPAVLQLQAPATDEKDLLQGPWATADFTAIGTAAQDAAAAVAEANTTGTLSGLSSSEFQGVAAGTTTFATLTFNVIGEGTSPITLSNDTFGDSGGAVDTFLVDGQVVAVAPVDALISVSPGTQNAIIGDTITVNVDVDAAVTLIAAGADISFDPAILQLQAPATDEKDLLQGPWATGDFTAIGTASQDAAAAVAEANTTGTLVGLSSSEFQGVAAGVTTFATLTFDVIGSGSSDIAIVNPTFGDSGGAVSTAVVDGDVVAIAPPDATISVSPSTQNVADGQTFTVDIEVDSILTLIAAGVDVTFDPSLVQLQTPATDEKDLLQGPWATADFTAIGTASQDAAAAVAEANSTGTLVGLSSSEFQGVAPGVTTFATLTFTAIAEGTVSFTLSNDTFGDSGGAINTLLENGNAVIGQAVPDDGFIPDDFDAEGVVTVTGNVQAGYLSISVPAALQFSVDGGDLARDADAAIGTEVLVESDVAWELLARDDGTVHRGHMVNAENEALIRAMRVAVPGSGFQEVNLAIPGGGVIFSGGGQGQGPLSGTEDAPGLQTTVPVELRQVVETEDQAGEYEITITIGVIGIF